MNLKYLTTSFTSFGSLVYLQQVIFSKNILVAGAGLEPAGSFDTRLWASLATNYWLPRYLYSHGESNSDFQDENLMSWPLDDGNIFAIY